MDAIDAALVDISSEHVRLVDYRQYDIPAQVQALLTGINGDSRIDLITRLDVRLAHLFAEAVSTLLSANRLDRKDITAIGCHGQTLLHRPEPPEPTTLQIGDPNLIAGATGITTVADFRRMDMAAGGQGAPLTPILHERLFRHPVQHRVIINIGGMANISILPPDGSGNTAHGFDTGPGNVLLDAWAQKHTGQNMDQDGAWAAAGQPDNGLLEHLSRDDYFLLAPPKSTGRDHFNLGWLESKLATYPQQHSPVDVQATLVQFTAATIAQAIQSYAPATQEVIVCGGGTHNNHLMHVLSRLLVGCAVTSSAELGLNPDALEAMTFAWLASLRLEEKTGNLPAVTGACRAVILGGVYLPGPAR